MTVKRSLLAAMAVCLLALTALAVPALSARPYIPDPVEFSVAPGADAVTAKRHGQVTYAPIKPSRRFNMAGFKWRRGGDVHLSVRTRQAGGGWSHWTPMDTDGADGPDPGSREPRPETTTNPVWTGDADQIQYRTDKPVAGLRAHFVNVRGSATEGDRLKTGLRRAVNSGVVSLSHLIGAGAASADAQPGIVSRAQWGASKCRPRTGPEYGTVKAAFIHHTVNPNDYTREEAPSIVLGICRFHRDSNGWNDIGYNFVVDRFGTIYEGRAGGIDKAVVGAQAQGYNSETTGIANLGTFTDVGQTPAALQAMARLIRWKLPISGVPTTGPVTLRSGGGSTNRFPAGRNVHLQRVIGHRDTGATECPGNKLYAQIPELRRLVAGASLLTTPTASLSAKLSKKSVAPGGKLNITGTLRDPSKRRIGAAKVQIQRKLGRRWRTITTVRTTSRGTYKMRLTGRVNRRVRAHFSGSGTVRAKASKALLLGVRASVKLGKVASRGRGGRSVRLSGKVKPRKKKVQQVLQLMEDGSYRTVGTKTLKTTRSGFYRGSFVPDGKGRYRVYVRTKRDSRNVASKSRRYVVKVAAGKPKRESGSGGGATD